MDMLSLVISRVKRELPFSGAVRNEADVVCRGYCQQMDTHEPNATVREALLFSARLRQPTSVPDEEKVA